MASKKATAVFQKMAEACSHCGTPTGSVWSDDTWWLGGVGRVKYEHPVCGKCVRLAHYVKIHDAWTRNYQK